MSEKRNRLACFALLSDFIFHLLNGFFEEERNQILVGMFRMHLTQCTDILSAVFSADILTTTYPPAGNQDLVQKGCEFRLP